MIWPRFLRLCESGRSRLCLAAPHCCQPLPQVARYYHFKVVTFQHSLRATPYMAVCDYWANFSRLDSTFPTPPSRRPPSSTKSVVYAKGHLSDRHAPSAPAGHLPAGTPPPRWAANVENRRWSLADPQCEQRGLSRRPFKRISDGWLHSEHTYS